MRDPRSPGGARHAEARAEDPADVVAAAVTAVPGVAGLHGGMFGEVGTYLAGRRVEGIRIADGVTEVHVVLHFGAAVRETAARIRDAVAPLVGGTVDVYVEDVTAPAPGAPAS
ncbi:Asp23/Gls24 family envelope stress response protein [Mycolicibacterium baixiangningiae]|uniref:Asp23/Gls24 family envelope stress response protein n=1 Tax=Mycolicibacterium baixiangningiae TaxID=2761578 RepID=UPI0018667711|nr:Asp23/Gls24 family envelope stress response protein [Mycolicibacterium baixiangningiae]